MSSEPERCILCGAPMRNMHHVTGRVLDVKFLAPLCVNCHKYIHDDWHTAGVGREDKPSTFLEALTERLTRLGMLLGRLAVTGWGGRFILTLAAAVGAWAARLRDCITVLNERTPNWRDWPEMAE